MDSNNPQERLSRITTLWTVLAQAHAAPADAATEAQRLLMQRYCGAVYRYLLGALRDEEAATELFQEFALRFLRGDFRRADRERGRFRDYLKTALIHMVTDHYRQQRVRPRPLPADLAGPPAPPEDPERDFVASWREELCNRAWTALQEANSSYYAVLRFHVENPDVAAQQAGAELADQLGKRMSAGQVRVTLHRARVRYAALLVAEVEHSLENPSQAELLEELRELSLAKLCRPVLAWHGR